MSKSQLAFIYKLFLLGAVLFILLSLYCMNSLYPLNRDDFIYAFHDGARIQTAWDIFCSVQHYYLHWFGRIIPTILTEIFVIQGKEVFNVCNVIVYFLFTASIAGLVRPFLMSRWVIISALFWIAIPLPEDTIFWMCGSCFYLWMYFFAALFLLALTSSKTLLRACALPLAAIAGIGNESVSLGLVTFLMFFSFIDRKQQKGKLYYCAIFVLMVSTAVCVLAPGNSAHASSVALKGMNPFLGHLLTAFRGLLGLVYHIVIDGDVEKLLSLVIFLTGGIANLYYRRKTGEYHKMAVSFLCASIICYIFPIVVNSASARALSISSFYTFLSLLTLTSRFQTSRKLAYIVPFAIFIHAATFFFCALPCFSVFNEGITDVRGQARSGQTVIVLPAERLPLNRFAGRSSDPTVYDPEHYISKYYRCQPYVVVRDDSFSAVLKDVDLKSLDEKLPYTIVRDVVVIKRASIAKRVDVMCDSPNDSYIVKMLSIYLPKLTRIHYFPSAIVDDGYYYAFIDAKLKNIEVTISYGERQKDETIHINSSL